ncbi:hypothetical protein K2224_32775 (plasmid) [Streptomyces sp. BHT-5-2]|uniref:hypothetical protein n=1 Tax=unclassified Streptomyces TaxID=2593676 RepID=UPI001C8DD8E8|nr:hypothetical protein [Streptomyces sp. BHT-5-2]QZL07959.1 hypothetical protein K2224_32775 [Streptomyces sp. BHT-5-2]
MPVPATKTATTHVREESRGRLPVARTTEVVLALLAAAVLSLALVLCGALIVEDGSGVRDEGPATDPSRGS